MRKLFFVVVVVVAAAACQPPEDKAALRSEVERRAEVQEPKAMPPQDPRIDGAATPVAPLPPQQRAELNAERAAFQQKSLERLNTAETQAQAVITKAGTSSKEPAITNAVVQDAGLVQSNIQSMRDKLPDLLHTTSDATWMMTEKSIDAQIAEIEKRISALEHRL